MDRESAAFLGAHIDQLKTDAVLLLDVGQCLPKLLEAQFGFVMRIVRGILRRIPAGKKDPFGNPGLSRLEGFQKLLCRGQRVQQVGDTLTAQPMADPVEILNRPTDFLFMIDPFRFAPDAGRQLKKTVGTAEGGMIDRQPGGDV